MPRKKKAVVPESKQSSMRRFVLRRLTDESGISGDGLVAEGVRLSNGQAILHWLSQFSTVSVVHSVDVIVATHGHDGKTVLEWIDDDPMQPPPQKPPQEPQP